MFQRINRFFRALLVVTFFGDQALASNLETISKVTSSSVLIRTHLIHGFAEDGEATGRWQGSGFVIDKKRGWIVTNAHVAGHGVATIKISFVDSDEKLVARRLFVDTKHDVAVLHVDPALIPETVKQLAVDCEYELRRGESVLAIGHPKGHDFTSTLGVLSGIRKFGVDGEFLTTDLVTESGSSGGPVVSLDTGLVVGMATAGYGGSDLGLLTKSRDLCRIIEPIKQGIDPSRPTLGFQFLVKDGDPSATVGRVFDTVLNLQAGDLVLGVGGKPWSPRRDGDLADSLRSIQAAKVILNIRRGDDELDIHVPIRKRGSSHIRDWVFFNGITVIESSHDDIGFRAGGSNLPILVVQSIDYDRDDTLDLEFDEYSHLVSIDGYPVNTIEELRNILRGSVGNNISVVARAWDLTAEAIAFHFEHTFEVEDVKSKDASDV